MWYANYLLGQGNAEQQTYAFNVIANSIDTKLLAKEARVAVQLTPEQQNYAASIYNDVANYVMEALRSKITKGYINPNFNLNRETTEDVVQEAIIKAMEVIHRYWQDRGQNKRYLWNTIKVSINNIIDKLTRSVQPTTKGDEYTRQYTSMSEPMYANPNRITVKLLDGLILEEFGPRAFQLDGQELEETIDYVVRSNQEFIYHTLQKQSGVPVDKFDAWLAKEVDRYKSRHRLAGGGGRHQTQGIDAEDLPIDDLMRMIGFEGTALEESAEQQVEHNRVSNAILNILINTHEDLRLVDVLVFGINPKSLDLKLTKRDFSAIGHLIGYKHRDSLQVAWGKLMDYVSNNSGNPIWSKVVEVVNAIYGSSNHLSMYPSLNAYKQELYYLIDGEAIRESLQ